ncbi:MAG: hypothetical protein ABSF64_24430 [Bryobacteraceae bacterium]|jgi:hypothetical protein
MTKFTTSILAATLMQVCLMTSQATADTGTTCDPKNPQSSPTTITLKKVNGSYQADPNAACVTNDATITWMAADSSWTWVVFSQ